MNNYYNVINLFVHEKKHYDDFSELGPEAYRVLPPQIKEQRAILAQISDPSWQKTDEIIKDALDYYAKVNMCDFKIPR